MPPLTTPDQVMNRTRVTQLADYFEVEPMTDAAGFAVRRYRRSSAAQAVLRDCKIGRQSPQL